jgi:hypothetical protein
VGAGDLSALAAALSVLERFGAWPAAGLVLLVVVGPWVMAFLLARGQERRFEAVAEMYRSNARLVGNYEKLCQLQDRREGDLRSIVMMNTQAMTRLTDALEVRQRTAG